MWARSPDSFLSLWTYTRNPTSLLIEEITFSYLRYIATFVIKLNDYVIVGLFLNSFILFQ